MRALSALLVPLVAGVCMAAGSAGGNDQLPRFEPAPCPMDDVGDLEPERIECGFLVVPETRGPAGSGGRRLRLAAARLKSRASEPAPDPVLYLHGGPGGQALRGHRRWLAHPLLERRDLWLLDQRGTGYSEPGLCPSLQLDDFRVLAADHTRESELESRVALALACRDALVAEGVDLGAYNSDASADDVADLRRALGIDAWNVYGISYGTKLALSLLRRHPEGVRSVVLDSAYPPGVPMFRFGDFARALDVLLAGCAADPDCRATYPDLERELYEAVDGLAREPLSIEIDDPDTLPSGRYTINAQDFVMSLHQGLYRREVLPILPLLIRAARERDRELLTPMLHAAVERAGVFNRAVYLTVECYERGPFLSDVPETPAELHAGLRPQLAYFDTDPVLCAQWSDAGAGPEEALPVRSDVPTLVLAGEYDPITPPEFGHRAASTLPASYLLEVDGVGHGVSVSGECPMRIVAAFLDDPGRPPDASCTDDMLAPDFVAVYERRPGLYRLARALFLKPRPGALAGVVALSLVLLASAVGTPLAGFLRRRRQPTTRDARTTAPASLGRARAFLALTSALALLFLLGLMAVLVVVGRSQPTLLGFGAPDWAGPLFALPWLAVGAAMASAIALPAAWRVASPGARARLAISLAAVAAFVALCARFAFF